jgi:hypothetical protein
VSLHYTNLVKKQDISSSSAHQKINCSLHDIIEKLFIWHKTTITPTRALETKNNFKHVSTLLFIVKVRKTRKTKAKSNIKEDEGMEMGKILMHHNHNCIRGINLSTLTSSLVDCGFEPCLVKPKDYKIDIVVSPLSTQYLRSKSKD